MQAPVLIKSWPAEGIFRIKAEILFGSMQIKGHEGDDIRVELSGRRYGWQFWAANRDLPSAFTDYDIRVEQRDDVLWIETSLKKDLLNWLRFIGLHFRILLPKHLSIETNIRIEAGNIRLEHCRGKHHLTTGAGTIRLDHVQGEIEGRSSAGTVTIRNCKASISAQTWAGTIEARDSEGQLTFSSSAGAIELRNLVGNVYATSSAGTIEARDIDGVLKVNTSAGSIEVRGMNGSLGAYTNMGTIEAEIDALGDFLGLESKAGNIYVQMPADKGMDLDISGLGVRAPQFDSFEGVYERNRIEGKTQNGGIPVRIRAQAGSVKIQPRRQNAFESFNKTLKDHSFTLPVNFFHFNFTGLLLSLAVCMMLTYGISSILYFSVELFYNNILSDIYKGIVFGHIINSIIALSLVYVFIKYLAHRIKYNWLKYATLIVLAFLLSIVGQILLVAFYWQYIDPVQSPDASSSSQVLVYLFIPCAVSCIYFFFWQRSQQITRKISEQEFQLMSLEKLKTRAELNALQARINPHFLYNSLNSIAGLVHEDADKAETMTLLLSKLFRFTIGTKDQDFNSVAHELEIVRTYLDIEQVRFGNRLSFMLEVEEGLSDLKIPGFLLQPVVENAIKHGISKISGQGRIEVHISREGRRLVFRIHDNGPAFTENFFTGYGLQSIQDKLKLLYGEEASLDIQNKDYKQVIIQLPC